MKQILLLIFPLLLSINAFAQDTIHTIRYDYEQGCDSGNQENMNICLVKARKIYDSILNERYSCLINSMYAVTKKFILKDSALSLAYMRMRQAIVESQESWKKMLEENQNVYGIYYSADSVIPIVDEISRIQDIKDRLHRIDDFLQVLHQDKLIKCE